MKWELYDHQKKMMMDSIAAFREGHRSIIIHGDTGCGKTIIGSEFAYRTVSKKNKFVGLFFQEKHLTQFAEVLGAWGLKYQIVKQNRIYINQGIILSMVKTFENRIKRAGNLNTLLKETDFFMFDEAHGQYFNNVIDQIKEHNPKSYRCGLTATPQRYGNQRQLYKDYSKLILGPNTEYLISIKKLSPFDYYTVKVDEILQLKETASGEYNQEDVYKALDKPVLYGGVFDNWTKYAKDKSTLIFCVNIKQAAKVCAEFEKNGIEAKFVSSKPAKPKQGKKTEAQFNIMIADWEERMRGIEQYGGNNDEITGNWRANKFHVLVNVDMYTAGFDRKDLECVIIYRATAVFSLWWQIRGRVVRYFEGKRGVILDFGNHIQRFKTSPTGEQIWSLVHETGKKSGTPIPASKICESCGFAIPQKQTICEFCGHADKKMIEAKAKKGKELTKIELENVDLNALDFMSKKYHISKSMVKFCEAIDVKYRAKTMDVYKCMSECIKFAGWECFDYFVKNSKINAKFVSNYRAHFFK